MHVFMRVWFETPWCLSLPSIGHSTDGTCYWEQQCFNQSRTVAQFNLICCFVGCDVLLLIPMGQRIQISSMHACTLSWFLRPCLYTFLPPVKFIPDARVGMVANLLARSTARELVQDRVTNN